MPTDNSNWYYSIDEVSYGPVTISELKLLISKGTLCSSSPVWRTSFGNVWRKVSDVPELSGVTDDGNTVSDTVAQFVAGANESPRVLRAIQSSWHWMRVSLFTPFNFPMWLGIAFCLWMASASSTVNFIDQNSLKDFIGETKSPLRAIILASKEGLDLIFKNGKMMPWVVSIILYSLISCYVRAKGRLMLMHKLHFPSDTISAAWKRTTGITRTLTYFYAVMDAVQNISASYAAFVVLGTISTKAVISKSCMEIFRDVCSDKLAVRWLIAEAAVCIIVRLVLSLTYHFAEPMIYGRGVSLVAAWRGVKRFCAANFCAVFRFILAVLVINIAIFATLSAFALLAILLMSIFGIAANESLLVSLTLTLPFVGKILLLPAYYFVRGIGPRFLGV